MNLVLEKGEEVVMGGKGRGKIRGEAGEVTGVVSNVPTTNGLRERNGAFSVWGMVAGKVKVFFLVVSRFHVDRGAEL
jgi:hypothetical protein